MVTLWALILLRVIISQLYASTLITTPMEARVQTVSVVKQEPPRIIKLPMEEWQVDGFPATERGIDLNSSWSNFSVVNAEIECGSFALLSNWSKGLQCLRCGKVFSQTSSVFRHLRSSHIGERPYTCEICKRSFQQKVHLQWHIRTHTGARPYKCSVCGKRFTYPHVARRHLVTHKECSNITYNCQCCLRPFKQKSNRDLHMRTMHSSQTKGLVCVVCGRNDFKLWTEFFQHNKEHSGIRPFPCKVCNKTFKTRQHLEQHARIHSNYRPYSCPMCLRSFKQLSHLSNHMTIHERSSEPVTCQVCHKKFQNGQALNFHLSLHTGKRSFQCQICGASFKSQSQIYKHLGIHNLNRNASSIYSSSAVKVIEDNMTNSGQIPSPPIIPTPSDDLHRKELEINHLWQRDKAIIELAPVEDVRAGSVTKLLTKGTSRVLRAIPSVLRTDEGSRKGRLRGIGSVFAIDDGTINPLLELTKQSC